MYRLLIGMVRKIRSSGISRAFLLLAVCWWIQPVAYADTPVLDLDADDSSGVTGAAYHTRFNAGGPSVPVADSDAVITDADSTELTRVVVRLVDPAPGDTLTVNGVLPGGITQHINSSPTRLILADGSGTASLAEFASALHMVEFSNGNAALPTRARRVEFVAEDDFQLAGTPVTTVIGINSDLAARYDRLPGIIAADADMTMSVNVTNTGTTDAVDVVMTVNLPVDTFIMSMGGAGWDCNEFQIGQNPAVICTMPVLPGGASFSVDVEIRTPSATDELLSSATLISSTAGQGTGEATATALVVDFDDTGALGESRVTSTAPLAGADHGYVATGDSERIFVGAPADIASGSGLSSGVVRVYDRAATGWDYVATLEKPGLQGSSDRYGAALDYDGDWLVVGAEGTDQAYVYDADTLTAQELVRSESGDHSYGSAVVVNGDFIAVGAPLYEEAGGYSNDGRVYIFSRNGGSWSQSQFIGRDVVTTIPVVKMGASLAMEGDQLLLGAPESACHLECASTVGAVIVLNYAGGAWTFSQLLQNPVPNFLDYFGRALAVDEGTLVVGSRSDDPVHINSGAGHVFVLQSGNWVYQQRIAAADEVIDEDFGWSVDIVDETILVGAINARTASSGGDLSGAAYVFQRSGTAWNQVAKLAAGNAAAGDMYGHSVVLAGNNFIAGAPSSDSGGLIGSGIVYSHAVILPTSEIKLTAPLREGAVYGGAVAVEGDMVIIGAPQESFGSGPTGQAGAVYVYQRDGDGWPLVQTLTGSVTEDEAWFGCDVAIQGDRLVVGSYGKDGVSAQDGAVYFFTRTGNTWAEQQVITASDAEIAFDAFGWAVDMDGDTLVASAYIDNAPTGLGGGSAYVFEYNTSTQLWDQVQKLTASDVAENLFFGETVSIHGDTLAVSASGVNGGVYVFRRGANGSWSEKDKLTGNDSFDSVAVYGNTVIAGNDRDDTVGPDAGAVHIFTTSNNNNWVQQQVLYPENPDPADRTRFGHRLALSNDTLMVAATDDDHAADLGGAAYVYKYDGADWQLQEILTASDAATNDMDSVFQNTGDTGSIGGSLAAFSRDVRVFGAWRESIASTAIDMGAVYLYPVSVMASVQGGSYPGAQTVELSCYDCDAIYYTTDGSDPVACGAGCLYTGPIAISSTTTLRFTSTDGSGNYETTQDITYTIDELLPAVLITAPLNDEIVSSLSSIAGTASDTGGAGLSLVQVELQNTTTGNYLVLNGPGSYDWSSPVSVWNNASGTSVWSLDTSSVPLVSETVYSIRVRAFDAVGNASAAVAGQFTFYTGSPAFTTLGLSLNSSSILIDGNIDITMNLEEPGSAGADLTGLLLELVITPPSGVGNQVIFGCTADELGVAQLDDLGAGGPYPDCTQTAGPAFSSFGEPGTWTLQAQFNDDGADYTRLASNSPARTLTVGTSAGYAVLIQGHLEVGGVNEGLAEHNKTANRIYRTLLERGFDADNIWYFNPDPNQDGSLTDPDNGNPAAFVGGIDGLPTQVNIAAVFNEPATTAGSLAERVSNSPAPVYVIEVSHGDPDVFYNDAIDLGGYTDPEIITPSELKGWMTTLRDELDTANGGLAANEPLIAVLGMCYSGSYIGPTGGPESLSTEGIYVITSADADELSYRGGLEPDGIRVGEYFLEEFFQHAGRGFDLAESFEYATAVTETFTRRDGSTGPTGPYNDEAVQHPLVDTNGDGVGANVLRDPTDTEPDPDGVVLANRFLGVGPTILTNSPDSPADIVAVTPTRYLADGVNTTILWLKANDDAQVEQAWVEIRAPTTEYLTQSGTVQVAPTLVRQQLLSPSNCQASFGLTGVWCTAYGGLTVAGMYEVFYFVQDVGVPASGIEGRISPAQRSLVYRNLNSNASGLTSEPTAFQMLSPADAASTPTVLMFDWTGSSDADGLTYTLEIAEDSSFSTVVYRREEISASNALVDATAGLTDLTPYFWRVIAVDSLGEQVIATHTDTGLPYGSFMTDNNSNAIPGVIYTTLRESQSLLALEGATVGLAESYTSLDVYEDGNGQYTLVVEPAVSMAGGLYTVQANLTGYTENSASGVDATMDPEILIELDALVTDTDGDGLNDADETGIYGTNPNSVDTDGDGLVDGDGTAVTVAEYLALFPSGPVPVNTNNDDFVDGEQDFGNDPTLADYADGDIAPFGVPDMVLNLGDFVVARQIIGGVLTLTGPQQQQALGHIDMNADGLLNAADLVLLRQAIEALP